MVGVPDVKKYMWCGYKITGLMLEHFYSKNYTIEMLSPSMYFPL